MKPFELGITALNREKVKVLRKNRKSSLICAKYNRTYDRIIQKYKEIDREKTYAKFNRTDNF
ncbi:MAG: hypothetical protein B6I38_07325 [Anaerolineaceae bacterium 4572_5.1]|nr:MAG: hypothetical protein B6I38_07325 [Anaerolineaceae bacterium 4572_5.1]